MMGYNLKAILSSRQPLSSSSFFYYLPKVMSECISLVIFKAMPMYQVRDFGGRNKKPNSIGLNKEELYSLP